MSFPTTNSDDVVLVSAVTLPRSYLDGQAGHDTITLTGGGDFYLTPVMNGWGNNAAPARFISFEVVRGSAALDRIYLSAEQLGALSLVDGGPGDRNFVFLTGSAIDTRATQFKNFTHLFLYDDGATLVTDDYTVASQASGQYTRGDHLILEGYTLSDTEFRAFHKQGFDQVTDGSGRTSIDHAPLISGVPRAALEMRNGGPVAIDPYGAIKINDDLGDVREVKFEVPQPGSSGTFGLVDTGYVSIARGFSEQIYVDGILVGDVRFGLDFTISLRDGLTSSDISKVLQAVVYKPSAYLSAGDGLESATLTAVDDGGRSSTQVINFCRIYDANGRGTMGGPLSDVLIGSAEKDVMWGYSGHDKLFGKGGRDVLVGMSGRDSFVFDTKPKRSNVDAISDFSVRDDAIWLDNAIFRKLGKGSEVSPVRLKKDVFTIGPKAQDTNDYLFYNSKKGTLVYDADGSGRGAAIVFATLSKSLKITNKDFFVI